MLKIVEISRERLFDIWPFRWGSQMVDGSKYDLVVKDLFQRDHPTLLNRLTAGVAVREILNVELARVEERRADLGLSLPNGALLHIEFQSGNDKDKPYRMGSYCMLLGQKYRRRVRQVVLYLGSAKMLMKDRVDLGETYAAYTLVDIRDVDARELMASGNHGDLALALLARGGSGLVVEIAKRPACCQACAVWLEGSEWS